MRRRKRERSCSYCAHGSTAATAPSAATALSATPASLLASVSCGQNDNSRQSTAQNQSKEEQRTDHRRSGILGPLCMASSNHTTEAIAQKRRASSVYTYGGAHIHKYKQRPAYLLVVRALPRSCPGLLQDGGQQWHAHILQAAHQSGRRRRSNGSGSSSNPFASIGSSRSDSCCCGCAECGEAVECPAPAV